MAPPAPAVRVEALSQRHNRETFSSGVEALDKYLRQQASQDAKRRVASCFVLLGESDLVTLGYYTLAATGIALAGLPERLTKRLPRYPVVPATLLGRLAVDAGHRRQGHGEFMLLDAFSRALRNEIASYALVVDLKDEDAARFYQRYGFRSLVGGRRRWFISMIEIAKLLSS